MIGDAAQANAKTVAAFLEKHPEARHIFRHNPGRSVIAYSLAKTGEAAHDQGRFWEFRERLLELEQSRPSSDQIAAIINSLKLDQERYRHVVMSPDTQAIIETDHRAGTGFETPTVLFVNGQPLSGTPTLAQIEAVVKQTEHRNG